MYWGLCIAYGGASRLVGSMAKSANQACQSHCINVHISQPGTVGISISLQCSLLGRFSFFFFQIETRDFVREKFPDERLES